MEWAKVRRLLVLTMLVLFTPVATPTAYADPLLEDPPEQDSPVCIPIWVETKPPYAFIRWECIKPS